MTNLPRFDKNLWIPMLVKMCSHLHSIPVIDSIQSSRAQSGYNNQTTHRKGQGEGRGEGTGKKEKERGTGQRHNANPNKKKGNQSARRETKRHSVKRHETGKDTGYVTFNLSVPPNRADYFVADLPQV